MTVPLEVAAYLAGAMDSDGSIGIRRSTYAIRVTGDSANPTFSERICLKQVTPQIPELLKETFGGSLLVQRPSAAMGRPLHYWEATNKVASNALRVMLPFLRIKRAQAENCLALRESKDRPYAEIRSFKEVSMSRNRWGDVAVRRNEVSPSVIAERQGLYERAKLLNKVGA